MDELKREMNQIEVQEVRQFPRINNASRDKSGKKIKRSKDGSTISKSDFTKTTQTGFLSSIFNNT